MFTGIISHIGQIQSINHPNDWEISVSIKNKAHAKNFFNDDKLLIGSSISCSGICLTLKKKSENLLFFDISNETASKTNFLNWNIGSYINLERSLKVGDELGGHFVYGHVDTTAKVNNIEKIKGSHKVTFLIKNEFIKHITSKGSVCVDGVSLTVNDVESQTFSVNIIPHTWLNTNFNNYKVNTDANIEIDILSRYLEKLNAFN